MKEKEDVVLTFSMVDPVQFPKLLCATSRQSHLKQALSYAIRKGAIGYGDTADAADQIRELRKDWLAEEEDLAAKVARINLKVKHGYLRAVKSGTII